MEPNSKRRMSVKPTVDPLDKPKQEKPKRRQSHFVKSNNNLNDLPQTVANLENQGQIQMMPPAPQIYAVPGQQMYYQQPYGQPVMMNEYPLQQTNSMNQMQGMQPMQPMQGNQYTVNQITPAMSYVPLKFGFESSKIVCPYCNQHSKTRIEQSFNICTCCTYIFIILLIPILIILAAYAGCGASTCSSGCSSADCDCNCNCCICGTGSSSACNCCIDYNHYCSNCGKRIGGRDSCQELCPCFSCCIC